MKKIYLLTIILSLYYNNITAQGLSQKDNASIDDLFRLNLVINKEKIVSDTLALVFKGTFYMVDPKIMLEDDEDSFSCRNMINITDEVSFVRFDTSLLVLVQDNFFLKNENDVIIFETAIDKLDPINDPEDLEFKEHLKSGDSWYFIRGKFFDSKKGFKVTVDKNARITAITYDLKALNND
jgi:hypothetical protein